MNLRDLLAQTLPDKPSDKIDKIYSVVKEALSAHQALRKLGFPTDDIYLTADDKITVISLKTQGKGFNISCGPTCFNEEEMMKIWTRTAEAISSGKIHEEELSRMYEESFVVKNATNLIFILRQKGIRIPTCNQRMN